MTVEDKLQLLGFQDIEMEVCEECWHEVFEMGEKYEEVQYYVNGE